MSDGRKLFKIAFDLPVETDNWPPVGVERLWGEKTDVKFQVRVKNVPFYARGIAYDDLIAIRADHDRREFVFERLVEQSGHSTVRLILMEPDRLPEVETALREAGCTWEQANTDNYLAVDVPTNVDYGRLRDRLIELNEAAVVGMQEASVSAAHGGGL